jgi:hypothetical protein
MKEKISALKRLRMILIGNQNILFKKVCEITSRI